MAKIMSDSEALTRIIKGRLKAEGEVKKGLKGMRTGTMLVEGDGVKDNTIKPGDLLFIKNSAC